jgi:hypothetical protein
MSSTYSAGSAASALGLNEPECEPSSSLNLTPSVAPSSHSTGPTCPATMTFDPFTLPLDLPMSSAGVSPARTSATQEMVPAWLVNALDYGRSTPDLLARYDPASSSWKTSQHCLVEGLETYSETWPRSGMTRSGTAYQLPPLVPLTGATDSGLLPTPEATNTKAVALRSAGRSPRNFLAPLWLTPRTTGLDGGSNSRKAAKARGMWPTPRAIDGRSAGPGTQTQTQTLLRRAGAVNLAEATQLDARRMWPTPQASDNRDRGNLSNGAIQKRMAKGKQLMLSQIVSDQSGALNPTWVEWLMGFPTGWTVCEAWATRSSRKSPKSSQWNAAELVCHAAAEQARPFVLLRPSMKLDGNAWCALYGENLMEGVAGFGNSPDAASRAFDAAWGAPGLRVEGWRSLLGFRLPAKTSNSNRERRIIEMRHMERVAFSTDDMPVLIQYPTPMGAEELAEVREFVALWLRSMERRVAKGPTGPTPAVHSPSAFTGSEHDEKLNSTPKGVE